MKEKPILFSGPMVKAILDNRKTMTRRVVKFSKPFTHADWPTMFHTNDGLWSWTDADKPIPAMLARPGKPCPYGQVGDRLIVKESLKKSENGYALYAADGEQVLIGGPGINDGVKWNGNGIP